ncbi:hypothetical protein PFISCL1PPCAC_7807, partial [Pristionchus fissidentatus]
PTTTTVTTTEAPATTTTVPTTTTTAPTTTTVVETTAKKSGTGSEELLSAGERPSWLDLSVFADNHHSLTTTTAATTTTTTTQEPTTTSTAPPPKENLVMQSFAATEKKKDVMKEAIEKRIKESQFGANIFDEIAESGDLEPITFSTLASRLPSHTRPFSPPPVPPLPTEDPIIGALEAAIGANNQPTRRPRVPTLAPPKAPSLQQERLPKAFRALVEDLETEAQGEKEQEQLLKQLKLEAQQSISATSPKPALSSTTAAPSTTKAWLDGTLTNEVDEFFNDAQWTNVADEKLRKAGRVGHRRRRIKGRKGGQLQQLQRQKQGELGKHSRIVRTQKRLVLIPEEEEIGKWVQAEEKARLSKLPTAAQPPLKGGERETPPPAFSFGNPNSLRTTPGPIQPVAITSRPYFNANSRTQVQQLQPQPDGTMAVRKFFADDLAIQPEIVRPKIKIRSTVVEPIRPVRAHNGAGGPRSARARDHDMQRIAGQIAEKMFPTTAQPEQVQPIRP